MKHNNFLSIALPLLVSALVSNTLFADDTEIFFNEEALADTEAFQPNVLFIFDTSGSMKDTVSARDPYDPNENYCTGTCSNTIYIHDIDESYLDKTIPSSLNRCDSMINHLADNTDTPVYIGKVAEWRSKNSKWKWRNIKNSTNHIECQDDQGVHGENDASTDIYAANGNDGPYSSSASDEAGWNKIENRLYVPENYHQYLETEPFVDRRKTDVMKEAASDLVKEFKGLNFGLMRFDDEHGGYVKHHFSDIESDRDDILDSIDELNTSDWTPLSETLWEAHKYFSGGTVEFGDNSNKDSAAVTDGNYNSPIADSTSSCQNNYVVYLTDGTPYRDSERDTTIGNLTSSTCSHSDDTSSPDQTCLDELAYYMANDADYNNSIEGKQNVVTHTIGFAIDMDLLEQTAINGQGSYHTANSSQELKTAFNEIILSILSTSTSFTAPAVSVNAYNSLQNRNELYYALFEPNIDPRWSGNIKKYTINSDGEVLDNRDPPEVAIDSNTGYFLEESKSYWSGLADGAVVQKGGASGELTNERNIFTVTGDATEDNISLNTTENKITLANSDINEFLGLDEDSDDFDTDRDKLVKWILGIDVNDDNENDSNEDANSFMADPLHNRPIVVTYSGDNSDPDNPPILDDVLFTTTNAGAFHAIDTSDGREIFSFIPQDLLPNQLDYFTDDPDGVRRYGLDGPMTVWRKENDSEDDPDINIEPLEGDHVYAYFGMRRGGNDYYALDVTDEENPNVLWTIFGGDEVDHPEFKDMGQTWSRPILSQVNWNCDDDGCDSKTVLFFGGGYDTVHDNATAFTDNDKGAVIYMVDALNGDLLWSAGDKSDNSAHNLNLEIENSIPGDLTVADMDGDGADDILFAVDIQGHVWRVDFNSESENASDFAQDGSGNNTGAQIADFQDTGTDASDPSDDVLRRFYTGPTVSLSQKRGQTPFFVITFGSGYVAHPKEIAVTDRLYSLFEYSILEPPTDDDGIPAYTSVGNGALKDMTDPDADPADPTAAPESDAYAYHGFYRDAQVVGEKFLRSALTIFGQTLYTSYIPDGVVVVDEDDAVSTTCGSEYLGFSRIYSIDFVTGKSVYTGEYVDLKHPGIAPEPAVLFIAGPDGVKTNVCVGTECQSSPDDDEECGEDGQFNCLPDPSLDIKSWRENLQ